MHASRSRGIILIADDDAEVRSYLETALQCQGYDTRLAEDGDEVLACLAAEEAPVLAVLLDLMMPRKDGLETLREIRRMDSGLPVIVISGACSPLNVVEAMRGGATDFLGKPVPHTTLCNSLQRVLAGKTEVPDRTVKPMRKQTFFGTSPRLRQIHNCIPQVGGSDAPVLILGETGAGKEVLARELHAHSPRANRAFVKLNCAALPSELVESELFGYERGAFTGAFQKKPGMFECADGGTIMLDEIGDMDYRLQAKLLQVLQDHEFQRLGGKETVRVDVRVIAATHQDLETAIANRQFREDLYYRLNIITIRLPPLRECRDDILPLAEFLIRKHLKNGEPVAITPRLREVCLRHHWPGNVRELENIVRKLIIMQDPDAVAAELLARSARTMGASPVPVHVPASPAAPPAQAPTARAHEPAAHGSILEQVTHAQKQAEIAAIVSVLNRTHWNRKQAAALLKIDYKALLYKMKKLGIEGQDISAAAGAGISDRTAVASM